jgi:phosphatidylglycerophosphate synthase
MTTVLPTALSASRFVLGVAFYLAVRQNRAEWCPAIWAAACLTDMCDGWLARRNQTVSQSGARLDTLADFVFLIFALVGLAGHGTIPFMVPLIATVMFGQFWLSRGPLVYDPIGKYYGAVLYSLVGMIVTLNDEASSKSATNGLYLFTAVSLISRVLSKTIWNQSATGSEPLHLRSTPSRGGE